MLGKHARMGVLVATVTVALALPVSASGAATIGSNLVAAPVAALACAPNPCTLAHAVLPAASQAPGGLLAKEDGVVVRWRIRVGVTATPVALRITRPGDSETRTGAGTSPTVTPAANQISTFEVRLPIQAGDALGIDCCTAGLSATATTSGANLRLWGAGLLPLQDGETPRVGPSLDRELLINADIEPDADGDGFGDETQDECPTDAQTQQPCPPDTDPPKTTITVGAPNKLDEHKVKFRFTSSEPDSTFECKLTGRGLDRAVKHFGDCDSPRKYRHLKHEGKFKFRVRAIDAAGNADPSPAKDKFKVVD